MESGKQRHDTAYRLQRLVLRLNRELRAQNAGSGASNADAMLLAEIRHRPGLGASDLAAIENVARSVMSERLKRLVDAGLVSMTASLRDRRRIGVTITPAGRAILKTITEKRRAWMADRLAALSEDERRAVEQAVDALERIVAPKVEEQDQRRIVAIGEKDHDQVQRRRIRSA